MHTQARSGLMEPFRMLLGKARYRFEPPIIMSLADVLKQTHHFADPGTLLCDWWSEVARDW